MDIRLLFFAIAFICSNAQAFNGAALNGFMQGLNSNSLISNWERQAAQQAQLKAMQEKYSREKQEQQTRDREAEIRRQQEAIPDKAKLIIYCQYIQTEMLKAQQKPDGNIEAMSLAHKGSDLCHGLLSASDEQTFHSDIEKSRGNPCTSSDECDGLLVCMENGNGVKVCRD